MKLKVLGDKPLFRRTTGAQAKNPIILWDVNGGIPLGSLRHLVSLRETLQREYVDDIVLFRVDSNTHEPTSEIIDPSLCSYDLGLSEGDFLYMSLDPFSLVEESAAENLCWTPLSTSTLRFMNCGTELRIIGQSKRRVEKIGPDGWDGCVAISNTALANGEINRCTFRISSAALAAKNGLWGGGGEMDGSAADVNQRLRDEALFGFSSADVTPGGDKGNTFPLVAVGLVDSDVPLDGKAISMTYKQSWMLDTLTGAFYSAGEKRPSFADIQNFKIFDGMMITFALDTEKGIINVILNGKNVLATKLLADALYPAVEIFSQGAVVDIM